MGVCWKGVRFKKDMRLKGVGIKSVRLKGVRLKGVRLISVGSKGVPGSQQRGVHFEARALNLI